MLGNSRYPILRNKFYQFKNKFTKFKDFDDESINKVEKQINIYKNIISKKGIFETYQDFLNFAILTREYTYDECVYMLIKIFDPDLVEYYEYKQTKIMDKSEVDNEDNSFVKEQLIEVRNTQIGKYKANVRNKIGFFEEALLNYEIAYHNKFCKTKLLFNNKKNESEKLFEQLRKIKSIRISGDRYEDIKNIVENYKTQYPNISNNDVFYHVLYQFNILGLKSQREQAIFLIIYFDQSLQLSQLYFEESKWDIIKARARELGIYFNQTLVYLEEMFVNEYDKELAEERSLFWK